MAWIDRSERHRRKERRSAWTADKQPASELAEFQRLQSAKSWLESYTGQNVVRGYRKHYGVDWQTALIELEMLGVAIDPDYKQQALASAANLAAARRSRRAEERAVSEDFVGFMDGFQDQSFAYIAGYTEGGFPYGVTWEEWEGFEESGDE